VLVSTAVNLLLKQVNNEAIMIATTVTCDACSVAVAKRMFLIDNAGSLTFCNHCANKHSESLGNYLEIFLEEQ
jgi:hypothetical protein